MSILFYVAAACVLTAALAPAAFALFGPVLAPIFAKRAA